MEEEKIYKEVIESRIKTTINKGAFESDDFIFLVEYYFRNRNHISKNSNDLINFSEIKEKSTNKEYKDFIKNNKGVHLIDYEKVKK